jgi:hypothetical protein
MTPTPVCLAPGEVKMITPLMGRVAFCAVILASGIPNGSNAQDYQAALSRSRCSVSSGDPTKPAREDCRMIVDTVKRQTGEVAQYNVLQVLLTMYNGSTEVSLSLICGPGSRITQSRPGDTSYSIFPAFGIIDQSVAQQDSTSRPYFLISDATGNMQYCLSVWGSRNSQHICWEMPAFLDCVTSHKSRIINYKDGNLVSDTGP